jgi:iron-sulfur cluster insertion protein
MPAPLVFTDCAAAKVKELVDEEAIRAEAARVRARRRLLGFQYGFTFDEAIGDDTQMNRTA